MSDLLRLVNTEAACHSLVRYLYSRTRKVPVVVVSQRRDNTGPCVKPPQFQEYLGPLARVYSLSGGQLKCFNKLLDNFYGIEPTGVRLYLPGMKANDYPTRHKVWNEFRIDTEFDSPEAFMESVKALLINRVEYQNNHKHQDMKALSFREAERLLFKQPVTQVETKHPRGGRKVLSLPKAKVTEAQVQALADKFKVRA